MTADQDQPEAARTLSAEEVASYGWAIRPCFLYQEEYSDCKSFKARFHQYFIHGDSIDCTQWNTDYKNCVAYEDKQDLQAATEVIRSEEHRRLDRLKAHYGNNVWTKRDQPPEKWNAPLPDFLEERNKGTYLELKAKELRGEKVDDPDAGKGMCSIM